MVPGRVFVISSPSGGGKTTIVKHVRRSLPRLGRSISVTTRAPRSGERHGRDYQFISTAAFQAMRRKRALLESAQVHGAWYGTPKLPIRDAIASGQSIILNIDVQGARNIRRVLGVQAVLIFLKPPSMARLRYRLQQRSTDAPDVIRQRLAAAKRELACAKWYDHVVVNDHLDAAVAKVLRIIRRTLQRSKEPHAPHAD